MIYLLLAALALTLPLQRTRKRLMASTCFVGVIALHIAITPLVEAYAPPDYWGYVYHGSACALYAIALLSMSAARLGLMGLYLQVMLVALFSTDFIGGLMWAAYQPHEPYNNTIFGLLAFSIFILATGGPHVWRNSYQGFLHRHMLGDSGGYGFQYPALREQEANQ